MYCTKTYKNQIIKQGVSKMNSCSWRYWDVFQLNLWCSLFCLVRIPLRFFERSLSLLLLRRCNNLITLRGKSMKKNLLGQTNDFHYYDWLSLVTLLLSRLFWKDWCWWKRAIRDHYNLAAYSAYVTHSLAGLNFYSSIMPILASPRQPPT